MTIQTTIPYVWSATESEKKSLSAVFQEDFQRIKNILLQDGAILFRGFEVDNPEKLEASVAAFPGRSVDYAGGNSPRTNLHGNVYTSTEQAAHTFISLHNELSYASQWPSHLFFCCQQPATEGGHTVIANSRAILQDLPKEVRETFKEKGIQYIRNLHGGYGAGPSWQKTFETEDQSVVEQHCRANDISFEWHGTKRLKLTENRAATLNHPVTGEEVWFNQADQFHPSTNEPEVYEALMEIYEDNLHEMPQYVCFQDGSEIPLEMLEEVRKAGEQHTVFFTWEKGDLLLLDNILTAHGRTPYQGARSILVAMLS